MLIAGIIIVSFLFAAALVAAGEPQTQWEQEMAERVAKHNRLADIDRELKELTGREPSVTDIWNYYYDELERT